MIQVFKDHYFSFLMGGTVDEFRAAAEALDSARVQGVSMEDLQKSMDEARTEAELLCVLFANPSLHGLG